MPKVRFIPQEKVRDIKLGATILAAANQCKIPIGQSCDGDGICGWCRVTVIDGVDHLQPPTPLEQSLMREKMFAPDERAACLAKVHGDVAVTASYW
jgi:ferredoxin